MMNCPQCHSPNIISNRPLTQAHIGRATDAARFLQTFGDRRLSVLAGLGALAMQGVNALYNECRCGACGHTFDPPGDQAPVV